MGSFMPELQSSVLVICNSWGTYMFIGRSEEIKRLKASFSSSLDWSDLLLAVAERVKKEKILIILDRTS